MLHNFLVQLGIKAIKYYQKRWASRFGGKCVFIPSCSNYAIDALNKYGFFIGVYKILKRILKCRQPNGGYDPV